MKKELHIFDTKRKEKLAFKPQSETTVGMYVCGPTVYDRAHLGNARPVVVFDVLFRLLKVLFSNVVYVRNITDVDDKINQASFDQGISIQELTRKTTAHFHADMEALNALPPSIEPRATEHIDDMITMIETLIENNHAYVAQEHVLFDVASFKDYGELSKRNLDDMMAGARVEVAPYKKNPLDFVLWKPSNKEQPGWQSPWGWGRPGWHIECSAMSHKHLGKTFDIHGGGQDLIFPHHDNEIAQTKCCFPKDKNVFAQYWMHNGILTVDGQKMSKSLGNFVTVEELLATYPGEVLRYFLLSAHYRGAFDWTKTGADASKKSLQRLYLALFESGAQKNAATNFDSDFFEALLDDLNTPKALSVLHDLAGKIFKSNNADEKKKFGETLFSSGLLIGLFENDLKDMLSGTTDDLDLEALKNCAQTFGIHGDDIEAIMQSLIEKRALAKKERDFKTADSIRDALLKFNIVLEDHPAGTRWKVTL